MYKKIDIKGITLNSEEHWIPITISNDEVQEGIEIGMLQESESKKLGLKDNSFSGDEQESLNRSITAKQAEIAVRKWGGGTARIVQVNEFHDHPDVSQVNVRYTFNPGYGLMLTNRDQNSVPMILCTGKSPNFYLMGWIIPSYAKYFVYKVHQGRNEDCESSFGFLQKMKDHEACHIPMQNLLPMSYLNKELVK